jgi:hypothetical protein
MPSSVGIIEPCFAQNDQVTYTRYLHPQYKMNFIRLYHTVYRYFISFIWHLEIMLEMRPEF